MIRKLAAVVDSLDAAAESPSALPSLLSSLVDGTDGLFTEAALFRAGSAGASFVLVCNRGASATSTSSRTWLRWPLRRLFTRMKPARIRDPVGKVSLALAIPFSYGVERYVVVAPLARQNPTAAQSSFFDVLERITIPEKDEPLFDSSDIPATPTELRIVAFALSDDLCKRIGALVRQRGWGIERALAYADLTNRFEATPPDVVAVDAASLADPLAAVTSIHRVANSAALRVILFADEPLARHGSAALVDYVLPRNADDEAIFHVLKELARDTQVKHRARAADSDACAARTIAPAITLQELSEFASQRAAELMRGWSCCVLIDEYGAVYRAEHPARHPSVLAKIPNTIFRGSPLFDLHVGDAFLSELTDDTVERMALMALKPFSGASAPITSGSGEPCGVLIGFSLRGWADSSAFEAFERLSRTVSARHQRLQPSRGRIPEFRQERLWARLRDQTLGLDIYRSARCRTPWRYRALDDEAGLLTFGLTDDSGLRKQLSRRSLGNEPHLAEHLATLSDGRPAFAGIIDFARQTMRFAANGFSPPLALSRPGPAALIQTVGGMATGNAPLGTRGGTLVCDAALWRWLATQQKSELRRLLDAQKPLGLASIVMLDSRPTSD